LIYYAILTMSLLVGISSYFNGSTVQVSILRFISFLLGASILSICFLSFVIIPIHVKRYYASARAPQKLENQHHRQPSDPHMFSEDVVSRSPQASTDNGEASLAMTQDEPNTVSADLATIADLDTVLKLRTQVGTDSGSVVPENPSPEDQASSLRRMVNAD
jgi:hypothetical protein